MYFIHSLNVEWQGQWQHCCYWLNREIYPKQSGQNLIVNSLYLIMYNVTFGIWLGCSRRRLSPCRNEWLVNGVRACALVSTTNGKHIRIHLLHFNLCMNCTKSSSFCFCFYHNRTEQLQKRLCSMLCFRWCCCYFIESYNIHTGNNFMAFLLRVGFWEIFSVFQRYVNL